MLREVLFPRAQRSLQGLMKALECVPGGEMNLQLPSTIVKLPTDVSRGQFMPLSVCLAEVSTQPASGHTHTHTTTPMGFLHICLVSVPPFLDKNPFLASFHINLTLPLSHYYGLWSLRLSKIEQITNLYN